MCVTKETLPQKSVQEWNDQGYARITNLLSPDEVARYHPAAMAAVGEDSGIGTFKGSTGLVNTVDAWEHSAVLREFATHPRIGAVAEKLAGRPLRVFGGEVLVKFPYEKTATKLHDDMTFEPLDAMTFRAWIALVDVPIERGCMGFLPGSHHRRGPARTDYALARKNFDGFLLAQWPELEWMPRVMVPLRAGDATFHHNRTAHLAGPNATSTARVSFAITYTDAEARYQPLGDDDPLGLERGQTLPDDRYPRVGGRRPRAE